MSPERKQRLYLIFIMILVATGVGVISIYTLYVADLDDHRLQMVSSIHEQAKVMEAVARFDKNQSQDFPGGNIEATLTQFKEAYRNFKRLGHSEEYTLAKLDKDQIVFLLNQHAPGKYDVHIKNPLPSSIPFDFAYAEPMRRALKGESGSLIGKGYLGQTVMAAYTYVDVLNFGLVMSIDLSEIKAPFIEAGLLATAGGFTIILFGVAVFYRASEPLVKKLDIKNKELSNEIANRRVTEDRLKLVLEGADAGTWDWNTQTNDVLFDNRFVEMLGYNQSEFEPNLSAWEKLVHPKNLPNVKKLLQEHLLGNSEFYEAEYPLRHKSGHWIWVLDKGKVVEWDSEGKPLRACGTHLDISKRKHIEAKLQTSEARYRGLIETMTSIQWNTDSMGSFSEPQHSWEKFTGQAWDEHKGWRWV
jgi:PAS domain S-box-containing protein